MVGKMNERHKQARRNIRISYRYGGGAAGNASAGAVTQLAVSVPSVDAVVNHLPAEGGADPSRRQLREPLQLIALS